MYLNNRHNGKYYKKYTGGKGLLGGGGQKKARALNLDGQCTFNKGVKDRNYVNPSFVSNMVFYGHSHERVDYPHQQEVKHHLKGEGYNLNNYVLYDGHRTEATTVMPNARSKRTDRTESRYEEA